MSKQLGSQKQWDLDNGVFNCSHFSQVLQLFPQNFVVFYTSVISVFKCNPCSHFYQSNYSILDPSTICDKHQRRSLAPTEDYDFIDSPERQPYLVQFHQLNHRFENHNACKKKNKKKVNFPLPRGGRRIKVLLF